jgi:hypothetical protein
MRAAPRDADKEYTERLCDGNPRLRRARAETSSARRVKGHGGAVKGSSRVGARAYVRTRAHTSRGGAALCWRMAQRSGMAADQSGGTKQPCCGARGTLGTHIREVHTGEPPPTAPQPRSMQWFRGCTQTLKRLVWSPS